MRLTRSATIAVGLGLIALGCGGEARDASQADAGVTAESGADGGGTGDAPPVSEFGDACSVDDDCASGYCVPGAGGKFVCTVPCVDECPAGWVCEQVEHGVDPVFLCVNKGDACIPGEERVCTVDNEHGSCFGHQKCGDQGTWNACDGAAPTSEVCNGLDDDCCSRRAPT